MNTDRASEPKLLSCLLASEQEDTFFIADTDIGFAIAIHISGGEMCASA
jgi:hypothetical protein